MLSAMNVVLGLLAVGFSTWAFVRFYKTTQIGRAISYMFLGEMICILLTLIFALLAHTGLLIKLNGVTQNLMRTVMFVAAIVTSVHLVVTIKRESEKR